MDDMSILSRLDGAFCYDIDGAIGIVYADTEEQARERVIEAYKGGGYGDDYDYSGLKVWKAIRKNSYLPKYPYVIEIADAD